MNLGEDYTFRDNLVKDPKDTVPIELLTGPYKGIILRYTKVVINENVDQTATLKFDYDLLKKCKFKEDKLRKDKMFEKHIGLILNNLILDSIGDVNDNRIADTQKPVEE